jgi:hypothetical protein
MNAIIPQSGPRAKTIAHPWYRGRNAFKRGCQLDSNLMKDENSDLLADSNNILNRRN